MKICSGCKEKKEFSDFPKNKSKKDGYARSCKLCNKEYQHKWYLKHKDDQKARVKKQKIQHRRDIDSWKNDLSCIKCGENYIRCLDFHHIDPEEKETSISRMRATGKSLASIMKEAEKCVVVCKNCHVKIHEGIIDLGV